MNSLTKNRAPASREARMRQAKDALDAGYAGRALAMLDQLIQDDPAVVVMLRASEIAQSSGQYRRGRDYMLHAASTTIAGKIWRALPFVARRALAFGDRATASRLLGAMDWDHPEVIRAAPVLSQLLWIVGKYQSAIDFAHEVERRIGPNHLLCYSRANALRYTGRMEEATDEFERTLEIAPGYAYAHWSLAYHQASDVPEIRIPRIQKVIAQGAETAEEMAALHYALFKEFDEAGHVDQAWAALETGMRFKRSDCHYEGSAEEHFMNSVLAGEQQLIELPSAGADEGPIFIVGMPRTGTTLLDRLLGAHTDTVSGGELPDLGHAIALQADDASAFPLPLCARVQISGRALSDSYLERTLDLHQGRGRLIDKHPMNFWATNHIMSMGSARVICMVRNPMDACFSNLKEMFSGSAYSYSYSVEGVADHYERFLRLARYWRDRFPQSFKLVQYEDLVADCDSVMADVQEFCGLRVVDLDHMNNCAPMVSASNTQARSEINRRSIGAWRKYDKWLSPMRERLIKRGLIDDSGMAR